MFSSFCSSSPKNVTELSVSIYNKAKANIVVCTDGDAWEAGLRVYHELNGGSLYNRTKIVKLPQDKDVCDLKGQIEEYYHEIK